MGKLISSITVSIVCVLIEVYPSSVAGNIARICPPVRVVIEKIGYELHKGKPETARLLTFHLKVERTDKKPLNLSVCYLGSSSVYIPALGKKLMPRYAQAQLFPEDDWIDEKTIWRLKEQHSFSLPQGSDITHVTFIYKRCTYPDIRRFWTYEFTALSKGAVQIRAGHPLTVVNLQYYGNKKGLLVYLNCPKDCYVIDALLTDNLGKDYHPRSIVNRPDQYGYRCLNFWRLDPMAKKFGLRCRVGRGKERELMFKFENLAISS